MNRMTRAEWEQRVATGRDHLGHDCWTPDHVYREAFRRQDVAVVHPFHPVSGLGCNIDVTLTTGERRTIRVRG